MNPQSDQIRALIDEIDELLHGGSNSFIWKFSGDRARHQDTLQRLRNYLKTLQYGLRIRNLPSADDGLSDEPQLSMLRRSSPVSQGSSNPFALEDAEEAWVNEEGDRPEDSDGATELEVRPLGYQNSEALLTQLSSELAQLRESLVAPLQEEVQQLRAQRNALQEEVVQLEIRRVQQQTPDQEALLQQFIETLMGRLQERMVKQVATILQQAMPQIVASQMAALPPAEAQQVQQLQKRANALLSNMDSTIRVFSQTLEQNVQAYQQSLSVGLERMHSMGRQGEAMLSSLVNRLADQMEQQTALYLQAPTSPSAQGKSVGERVQPFAATADSPSLGASPRRTTYAFAASPLAASSDEGLDEGLSETEQRVQWEAHIRAANPFQSQSSSGILTSPSASSQGNSSQGNSSHVNRSQGNAPALTAGNAAMEQRPFVEPVPQSPISESSASEPSRSEPLIGAPVSDLEAFYAGFDQVSAELQQALADDPLATERPRHNAADTTHQVMAQPQPYRNLEEALFDGIPEGELWTSPWEANSSSSQTPTSPPEQLPPELHTIRSLSDLVNRTFQDLEQLQGAASSQAVAPRGTSTTVLEPPNPTPGADAKKKTSPPCAQLLNHPKVAQIPRAS